MNKVRIIKIGYSLLNGIAAGYFVHRLIDEKTTELVTDGSHGIIDACVIGAGQGALSVVSGMVVADVIMGWIK